MNSIYDCTCLLVIWSQSDTKQHEFNTPYQLSYPELKFGTDFAKDGLVYDVPIESGDVLIMGSDGLFDNLFPEDIARLCDGANINPNGTAEILAAAAREKGLMGEEYESPFQLNARKAFGDLPIWRRLADLTLKGESEDRYKGGKLDDITVLVTIVKQLR